MVLTFASVVGTSGAAVGAGSRERPARNRASAVAFLKLRTISFRLPPALSRLAMPLPTASDILRVAPVVESATAVAAPVRTPVAMLWRLTALRTDFVIRFVVLFFFIGSFDGEVVDCVLPEGYLLRPCIQDWPERRQACHSIVTFGPLSAPRHRGEAFAHRQNAASKRHDEIQSPFHLRPQQRPEPHG